MRLTLALLLAAAAHAGVVYQVDDGTANTTVGLESGGSFFWLNRFTAQAGGQMIGSISVAFGIPGCSSPPCLANGTAFNVYLWSDPNQDGNPTDAVVLSTAAGLSANVDSNTFVVVPIPTVTLGTGDRFFVGAGITHPAGKFPAALDTTTNQGVSWVSGSTNPNSLSDDFLSTIGGAGFPGNWLVRAEAVPEPASWMLLGLGLGVFGLARRAYLPR